MDHEDEVERYIRERAPKRTARPLDFVEKRIREAVPEGPADEEYDFDRNWRRLEAEALAQEGMARRALSLVRSWRLPSDHPIALYVAGFGALSYETDLPALVSEQAREIENALDVSERRFNAYRALMEASDALHAAIRVKRDGDPWIWIGDGTDDLGSMGDEMTIKISASALRDLLNG